MAQTAIIMAISSLSILLSVLSSFFFTDTKIYVVYLGEKEHDDPESVTESHHQLLQSLLGSKKAARDSIVYSYRHGFSGFAAKLTESQAQQVSELPEVVHVIQNTMYELKTTRTWEFLRLAPGNSQSLLNKANMGSELIVGVLDSGITPESEMFSDKGYGPIPSRWKGSCQSGQSFNASIHCNKKLIGAKYYFQGSIPGTMKDFLSPRDYTGHGTHVSSTIGGSFTPNVSYLTLGIGTARGGAPKVHIAMYKVCWNGMGCSGADILKGIDEAINDGVDVLSMSIGPNIPLDQEELPALGAFHAVAKGIPFVASAGNDGPIAQTITNIAPWILTVAATTLDRSFPTFIILGNNLTVIGQALFPGPEINFVGLAYLGYCEGLSTIPRPTLKGKIVLCFTKQADPSLVNNNILAVQTAGGLGVIVARNPDYFSRLYTFPVVLVDFELGTDILSYIRSTSSPIVSISASFTLNAKLSANKVATFSSRGPNSFSPAILKPDIAAPGVKILAATSLNDPMNDNGFEMMTGTSMATPIVSGVVLLLKSLYPQWSPSAIRSAIVTTAWKFDPSGDPIFAEGSSRKLADPFDYGGGLINPEKAAKPGLIYDMTIDDYVFYLCAANYNETSISRIVGNKTVCPNPRPFVFDVNLPSITIPNLGSVTSTSSVVINRTVTNVGPPNSVYKVIINPPFGVNMIVSPSTLVFGTTTTKLSFRVLVETKRFVNTGYYFGSLTWTDNTHNVVIPISVRTQVVGNYFDGN